MQYNIVFPDSCNMFLNHFMEYLAILMLKVYFSLMLYFSNLALIGTCRQT